MIENNYKKIGIAPVVVFLIGHLFFLFMYEILLLNTRDTDVYETIIHAVSPLVDFLSPWLPAIDLYYKAFYFYGKGHWAEFSQNIYVISLLVSLVAMGFIYRYRKNMALLLSATRRDFIDPCDSFVGGIIASVICFPASLFFIYEGKAKHSDNIVAYIMFNNLYFFGMIFSFVVFTGSVYGLRHKNYFKTD